MYVCMYVMISFSARAQSFTPPALSEYINPPLGSPDGDIFTVSHLSNYHRNYANFIPGDYPETAAKQTNLYVWTWGAINVGVPYGCGIGWKRVDPTTNAIVDDGYITLRKLTYDPEIAFIQHEGVTYVYLAYYRSIDYSSPGPAGHYYDVYRWDNTTLTPISLDNPLGGQSTGYNRISIDAIDLNKILITWASESGIYVKAIASTGSGLVVGNDRLMTETSGRVAPDAAISYNTTADKFYVYVLSLNHFAGSLYDYIVDVQEYSNILTGSGTVSFAWDDSRPHYFNPIHGMHGWVHQLDAPDRTDSARWAYTWLKEDFGDINTGYLPHTTMRLGTTFPFDVDLGEGLFGVYHVTRSMTVAYDENPRLVHFGFSGYYASATPIYDNYFSVMHKDDGSKADPLGFFKIVANNPYGRPSFENIAFSKANSNSKETFASYNVSVPGFDGNAAELRHKHVPPPSGSFRQMALTKTLSKVVLFPNPTNSGVQLQVPESIKGNLRLEIFDIKGRQVVELKGFASDINFELLTKTSALIPGTYFGLLYQVETKETPIRVHFVKL